MRLFTLLAQVEVPAPSAPPELAGTLGQILSWVRYGTLWAGGLTVLVSALVWGISANTSNIQHVSRAKAGILTQWQRPELYDAFYPRPEAARREG